MSLNLVTLVGSVRSDRLGIRAARFVERSLRARAHHVTLVDPVEARLPLLDRMYKDAGATWGKAAFETFPQDALEDLTALATQMSKRAFFDFCLGLIERGPGSAA